MIGPTVKVYRNRRTGQLRIQPYARHFSTPQEFGAATILEPRATDLDLLQAILGNLLKTETQEYDLETAPKIPPDERRRMIKEEQPIIVRRMEDGYELAPMQKMRNSFGSIEEMTRTVAGDEFEKHGGKIIRQLFESMP